MSGQAGSGVSEGKGPEDETDELLTALVGPKEKWAGCSESDEASSREAKEAALKSDRQNDWMSFPTSYLPAMISKLTDPMQHD